MQCHHRRGQGISLQLLGVGTAAIKLELPCLLFIHVDRASRLNSTILLNTVTRLCSMSILPGSNTPTRGLPTYFPRRLFVPQRRRELKHGVTHALWGTITSPVCPFSQPPLDRHGQTHDDKLVIRMITTDPYFNQIHVYKQAAAARLS